MKDHRVALRYASALVELADQTRQLEEINKELSEATELLEKYPEVSHLVMNSTIAREEKEDFLEKILPERTSGLLVNFLKVLIKKSRFQDLALIREKFQQLYEGRKGIQRVHVHAPIALDEALQERLRRALEKKLKREVYLEPSVNPELLGGLLLDFDGTQIDGSFRTALSELRQRLLTPLC